MPLLAQLDTPYGHGILAVLFWVGLSAPAIGLFVAKLIRRDQQANKHAAKVLVFYLIAGPLGAFMFFGIRKSCIDIPFFVLLVAGLALGWSTATGDDFPN